MHFYLQATSLAKYFVYGGACFFYVPDYNAEPIRYAADPQTLTLTNLPHLLRH